MSSTFEGRTATEDMLVAMFTNPSLVEPTGFDARLHTTLASVETAWRALERDGACTAFQQFDWMAAIAANLLRPSDKLLIVELCDPLTGATLMIWPLMRRRANIFLSITWLSCGVCDYAAPLMAPGLRLSPKKARRAWAAVRSVLPSADFVTIDEVPLRVQGAPNPIALLGRTAPSPHATFGTVIAGDPATVLERVAKTSVVKEVAMKERRLAKRGAVSFEVAATPAQVDELFDVLLEQRLPRFAKLGRFDLLAQPEAVAFYRQAAQAGLDGGAARLFALRVGDQWVATCYGLVHDGAFHISLLSIADDSWRNCSPGFLLVVSCMRWSREQDLTYFDFTIGDHGYKTKVGGQRAGLVTFDQPLTGAGQIALWCRHRTRDAKAWLQGKPALFDRLRETRRALRRRSNGLVEPAFEAVSPGDDQVKA